MVKTTTRPKCARVTKAQTTAEDQIDAAIAPQATSSADIEHPISIEMRPYDLMRLSRADFLRSDAAETAAKEARKSSGIALAVDRQDVRDRYFFNRSCVLEDLVSTVKSRSVADSCAQLSLALTYMSEIHDEMLPGECAQKARQAVRLLLGAWGPVAEASERPLWEIMDLFMWMKAAEAFGDIGRHDAIHAIRRADNSEVQRLLYPTPVTSSSDDSAFIQDCNDFAAAEAAWQKEYTNLPNDRAAEEACNAKWGPVREDLLGRVFRGKATTPEGHAARARAIAVESGWQHYTIENHGWSEGMLGALVRDLIGGAA